MSDGDAKHPELDRGRSEAVAAAWSRRDFDQLTPGQRKTIAIQLVVALSTYTLAVFTVLMLVRPAFCLAALSLCCFCCFCTSPPPVVDEVVQALVQHEQHARESRG